MSCRNIVEVFENSAAEWRSGQRRGVGRAQGTPERVFKSYAVCAIFPLHLKWAQEPPAFLVRRLEHSPRNKTASASPSSTTQADIGETVIMFLFGISFSIPLGTPCIAL